jgi:chorismate dehydratase
MTDLGSDSALKRGQSKYAIGAVSFLNAKPLIEGLDELPNVKLQLAVPAKLPDLLDTGRVDVALVPTFDLGCKRRDWRRVSDGCIASDGQTMTVRVFSRVPPDRITMLHADADSHTSVALAGLLWRKIYGSAVPMTRIDTGAEPLDQCQAVLLIGDKVVSDITRQFGYQMDLGAVWKELTGLPFVFAVWAARRDRPIDPLVRILSAARDRGLARAEVLAHTHGPPAGWPAELATRYLQQYLSYTLTPRHCQGLDLFLQMAQEFGLLGADTEAAGSTANGLPHGGQI